PMNGRSRIHRAALLALLGVPACGAPDATAVLDEGLAAGASGQPHVFRMRDPRPASGTLSSTLMTLHRGAVLPTNTTWPIWWGTEWSSSAFAGDKITGMDLFFRGMGGSNYAGTSTEYYGSNGAYVTRGSTFGGNLFDASAAPANAISVTTAVNEVCK